MSHISVIRTQIVERDCLLKALDDLGYRYETGNLKLKGYGGQQTDVEILIRRPLSADIGLRRNNNSYEIVADWFSVLGIKREEFTQQLLQRYAYHTARTRLEEQGFTLIEETQEKGQIRLLLRRAA
ncbi:MAG: DUF1257 domain-containing protein [Anaerolinea sp.]|nr:DUF1257 domain-containing protein [Anaerolinea sp.]